MLHSDLSAQHLSVWPINCQKRNDKKYSSSQEQTSEFFVLHRRVFAELA